MRRLTLQAALFVLFFASAAWACPGCGISTFRLLPGFWALTLEAVIPIYILSAFIERPFLTSAGVNSNTIWHSITSSFLAMVTIGIGGWVVLFVGWGVPVLLPFWLVGSVFASAMIKYWFLGRPTLPWANTLRGTPFVWGSLASHGTVLMLPVLMAVFGFNKSQHFYLIEPIQLPVALLCAVVGIAVWVKACVSAAEDLIEPVIREPRGFEVVAPETPKN